VQEIIYASTVFSNRQRFYFIFQKTVKRKPLGQSTFTVFWSENVEKTCSKNTVDGVVDGLFLEKTRKNIHSTVRITRNSILSSEFAVSETPSVDFFAFIGVSSFLVVSKDKLRDHVEKSRDNRSK
jgi:hypothetical protein